MNNNLIGYELFLADVSSAVYPKKQKDDQLTESEFKQVVAGVFLGSVIRFMKDSYLFRAELPIDLYQDVKRYDIIPPRGFLVEDVVSLQEHKVNIPAHSHSLKEIILVCCPIKDVHSAFFVEVALSPKRSSGMCEFDEDFLEMHYDAILENMLMRLARMTARTWRSLGSVDSYKREYLKYLNKDKRQALNGGGIIRLHTRRLSANGSSR